ncbi:hypothetical protein CPC08DRAFT_709411 [Agrocybe pediades]|nr:hypothetical protein CPC08DRAFT_709411 [Agrocybe pediades]
MSNSAFTKLPFIVLYTYSWYRVMNPPQPKAKKEELRSTAAVDVLSHAFWRVNGTIYTQLLISALEIGVILAASGLPFPGAQTLLSNFQGTPQNLHLNTYSTTGAVFMAMGAVIRLSCYRAMGSFFRYEVSIQSDHQLIVTGPYSFVRHPGYTGLIFAIIGWFLWNWSEGSWVRSSGILNSTFGSLFMVFLSTVGILGIWVVTLGRMTFEDKVLHEQFGKQWEDWAKRVPYFVLPGIW